MEMSQFARIEISCDRDTVSWRRPLAVRAKWVGTTTIAKISFHVWKMQGVVEGASSVVQPQPGDRVTLGALQLEVHYLDWPNEWVVVELLGHTEEAQAREEEAPFPLSESRR